MNIALSSRMSCMQNSFVRYVIFIQKVKEVSFWLCCRLSMAFTIDEYCIIIDNALCAKFIRQIYTFNKKRKGMFLPVNTLHFDALSGPYMTIVLSSTIICVKNLFIRYLTWIKMAKEWFCLSMLPFLRYGLDNTWMLNHHRQWIVCKIDSIDMLFESKWR